MRNLFILLFLVLLLSCSKQTSVYPNAFVGDYKYIAVETLVTQNKSTRETDTFTSSYTNNNQGELFVSRSDYGIDIRENVGVSGTESTYKATPNGPTKFNIVGNIVIANSEKANVSGSIILTNEKELAIDKIYTDSTSYQFGGYTFTTVYLHAIEIKAVRK